MKNLSEISNPVRNKFLNGANGVKILLVWPKFQDTFWSFKYALPFLGKKAAYPPLGLLTVAALLPKEWQKKLVDLNVEKLKDKDVLEADFIFLSAMIAQKKSVKEIIKIIKKYNKKIVAGGPLFTTGYKNYLKEIDHFVLGEAEITLPPFLEDLEKGSLKKIYKAENFCDLRKSPTPLFGLIDFKKYASLPIQYSRGCPFNCEFCDIKVLCGPIQRTKTREQILNELTALYEKNWREGIFFVDDNFIGNKEKLKIEILPAIIEWQKERNFPFTFITQASINLADDEKLMDAMVEAGFKSVFVGIESVEEESLKECKKFQNVNRDLLKSVKIIQAHGLEVQGGFILGFDSDTPSVFERIKNFIQKSGICAAMVGLLQAPPMTRLWERLKKEKRLLGEPSGENTDGTLNFIPKMKKEILISGYKRIVKILYKPKNYYQRIINFLRNYKPKRTSFRLDLQHFFAFLKSIWYLGIKDRERFHYWKLLFWTLIKRPKSFPKAIELAIFGFHFRKSFEKI